MLLGLLQDIYKNEKCGDHFVYLQEGCGKGLNKNKRCNTPHLNRYEVRAQELRLPHKSKQAVSVVIALLF